MGARSSSVPLASINSFERPEGLPQTENPPQEESEENSKLKNILFFATWIEFILGWSVVITDLIFGVTSTHFWFISNGYLCLFGWLIFATYQKYLKSVGVNDAYWIFTGCTFGTVVILLSTFLGAPNVKQLALNSTIFFLIGLIIFSIVCSIFNCYRRGSKPDWCEECDFCF